MRVLLEVAVDAVHPLLQVDVLQVHGLLELLRILGRHDLAVLVQQIAVPVALVHVAEQPTVAVEVRQLHLLQRGVHVGRVLQELVVRPQSAHGGLLGIEAHPFQPLLLGGVALFLRVEAVPLGLVVPPQRAQVGVRDGRAGVHVADDALAGRDGARHAMRDRVAALVLRNRRVGTERQPLVAVLRVAPGVHGAAVVRVDHVAGGAARRAILAAHVVRAREVEHRIQQPRLLQGEPDRVRAVQRAEPARAQAFVRLARLLQWVGRARERHDEAAAALEDAQDVARLADLEAR